MASQYVPMAVHDIDILTAIFQLLTSLKRHCPISETSTAFRISLKCMCHLATIKVLEIPKGDRSISSIRSLPLAATTVPIHLPEACTIPHSRRRTSSCGPTLVAVIIDQLPTAQIMAQATALPPHLGITPSRHPQCPTAVSWHP